ncbi:MAG: hypothetical protein GY717_04365 [Rhodobacteraceae bacterium]|nr:hypothetical protein [Paracoccaceae bacterium]
MAEKRPLDDTELDGLFAAARSTGPEPSGDLLARIMGDADAKTAAVTRVSRPEAGRDVVRARPGLLATLLGLIGGWPAAAGLMTATVAGLAIGLATPDTLDDLTGGVLTSVTGYELEDFMPSYGDLLEEG